MWSRAHRERLLAQGRLVRDLATFFMSKHIVIVFVQNWLVEGLARSCWKRSGSWATKKKVSDFLWLGYVVLGANELQIWFWIKVHIISWVLSYSLSRTTMVKNLLFENYLELSRPFSINVPYSAFTLRSKLGALKSTCDIFWALNLMYCDNMHLW